MHMKPQRTKGGRADVAPATNGALPKKVAREDLLEIQGASSETQRLQALLSKAQTEVHLLPFAVEKAQQKQAEVSRKVWAKYGMTDADSFNQESLDIIRGAAAPPVEPTAKPAEA